MTWRIVLLCCSLGLALGCDGGANPAATDAGGDEDAGAEGDGASADDAGALPDDASTGPADAGEPDATLSFDDSLDALGVNRNQPEYPAGLSAGYHPLGRTFTTLDQRDEIVFFKRGQESVRMYDDALAADVAPALSGTPLLASEGWRAAEEEAAIAADVDGDGADEIVVLFYEESPDKTLSLYVVDRDAAGSLVAGDPHVIAVDVAKRPVDPYLEQGFLAVQLDDDPAEELAIGFGEFMLLDDGDTVGERFDRIPLVFPGGEVRIDSDRISVAAGDLDGIPGDPTDEIAVCHSTEETAAIEIFDGATHLATRTARFMLNGVEEHVLTEGQVVIGNFDARKRDEDGSLDLDDEIAVYGVRPYYGGPYWVATLMDGKDGDFAWYRGFSRSLTNANDGASSRRARRIDVDGDGVDELYAERVILGDFKTLPKSSEDGSGDAIGPNLRVIDVTMKWLPVGGLGLPNLTERMYVVTVGNVARLRAPAPGQTVGPIEEELVGVDQFGRLLYGGLVNDSWTWKEVETVGGTYQDTIVLGDFDRDSARVRFRGEHELLFSEPKPIALLAAPPFFDEASLAETGASQPTGNTYTALGKGTGSEVSDTESMNVTAGWSIGIEGGIEGVVKVEASVSFERKFDQVTTRGVERSEWITYATGPEDSVVFTSVPFDVYYYEVVSSPVAGEEGTVFSLNIPREPQTSLVTAAFYDRNRGATPPVAPYFTHTTGRPYSYPTESDRSRACADNPSCFVGPSTTVGEGSGYTEIYISKANNKAETTSFDFQITAESKLTAGGVSVGHSVGFGYGFGVTCKTTETTAFTGRVSNIVGRTGETTYDFGLFARQVPFGEADSKVMLVDYWVK